MENRPKITGCKYATKEEAEEAHRKKVNERNKANSEKYKEYQRDYQRDIKNEKILLKAENLRLIEQNLYQQQRLCQTLINPPNIIVTPNFTLEIIR